MVDDDFLKDKSREVNVKFTLSEEMFQELKSHCSFHRLPMNDTIKMIVKTYFKGRK